MQKVSDIFALWPSDADLGRDIGLSYPTVSAWKQRGSIPATYWRDIIRAAHRRGYRDLTADVLTDLHARPSAVRVSDGLSEEDAAPYTVPADPEATANQGHFSRWKHLRRSHFASGEEVAAHVRALREEWDRR